MKMTLQQKCGGKSKQPSKPTNEYVDLRPSKIRYSQCSIRNTFQDGTKIGELLDDLYDRRCFVSALKPIEVARVKKQWISADNRRLWVMKLLGKAGELKTVRVKVIKEIDSGKRTSKNGGLSVTIRGGEPGGTVYEALQTVLKHRENNANGKEKTDKIKKKKTIETCDKKSTCSKDIGTKECEIKELEMSRGMIKISEEKVKRKRNKKKKNGKLCQNSDNTSSCSKNGDGAKSEGLGVGGHEEPTQDEKRKNKRNKNKEKKSCNLAQNIDNTSSSSKNGDDAKSEGLGVGGHEEPTQDEKRKKKRNKNKEKKSCNLSQTSDNTLSCSKNNVDTKSGELGVGEQGETTQSEERKKKRNRNKKKKKIFHMSEYSDDISPLESQKELSAVGRALQIATSSNTETSITCSERVDAHFDLTDSEVLEKVEASSTYICNGEVWFLNDTKLDYNDKLLLDIVEAFNVFI